MFGLANTLPSPRERVRAGGGDQPLRHPVVDVEEAIERRPPEDADVVERAAVELHMGEVLEQHVVRLAVGALELLPGQGRSMLAGEGVDLLTDDDPQMFEAHA